MSDQLTNAIVATVLGTGLAIVLLIPTAAYQYRLDGRLQPRDLTLLLSGAIYGLALWTYTLLPMPAADDFRCVGRQTEPLGTLRTVDIPSREGLPAFVTDPAFLQIALNVLLFVPLGYFVRAIGRRGVVVATLLGLTVSLAIETTQTTGVWFLYDCAYRLFDVDDLIVNTVGATLGSLVAALFVRRQAGPIEFPTEITWGRRMVGLFCDALFVVLLGAVCALAYRGLHVYVWQQPLNALDPAFQDALQWGVPGLAQAVAVLLAGRTVGEWVVSVRARARRRWWAPAARLIKLSVGIGPFVVLGWMQEPWTSLALPVFAAVTIVAAAATRDRRGLSHTVAAMELEIVRPKWAEATDPQAPARSTDEDVVGEGS